MEGSAKKIECQKCKNSAQKMEFLDFPNEIICFIGTLLDGKHARNFSECNKRIHDIMAEQIWERPRFEEQEAEILESLTQYNIKELWLNDFINLELSMLQEIKSLQVLVIKGFKDWGTPDLLNFKQCDFKLRLHFSCMDEDKIAAEPCFDWPENENKFDEFITVCKEMDVELVIDHGEDLPAGDISWQGSPWSPPMLKKCTGLRMIYCGCMPLLSEFSWDGEAEVQLIKELGIKVVACEKNDERTRINALREWKSEMDLYCLILMP